MNAFQTYLHRIAGNRRAQMWEAMWECYHYSVNRQDRKLTIKNIIRFGFSAREAIAMVQDCEREG